MKKKIPEVTLPIDTIRAVDKDGNDLIDGKSEKFLGTNPVYLSRSKPIAPVQMFLPPGITRFFVHRIDKNHIRFLISKEEMDKMEEKIATISKGINDGKTND